MLELTPTPQDQNSFLEKEVRSTAFDFFFLSVSWLFVCFSVCFIVVVVVVVFFFFNILT